VKWKDESVPTFSGLVIFGTPAHSLRGDSVSPTPDEGAQKGSSVPFSSDAREQDCPSAQQ